VVYWSVIAGSLKLYYEKGTIALKLLFLCKTSFLIQFPVSGHA